MGVSIALPYAIEHRQLIDNPEIERMDREKYVRCGRCACFKLRIAPAAHGSPHINVILFGVTAPHSVYMLL